MVATIERTKRKVMPKPQLRYIQKLPSYAQMSAAAELAKIDNVDNFEKYRRLLIFA